MLYLFRKPYVFIEGYKLYINKMDTVVSDTLMNQGVWEPYVTNIYKKYAKNSKVILDIGANLGYYTILAAKCIKVGGKIFAFEPVMSNFNLLNKTVINNNLTNVVMEKIAIGSKNDNKKIYLNMENYGDNRIYSYGKNCKKEKIKITSLDNYFSKYGGVIDLIKMDIQGYELEAISGAENLLKHRRINIIISELWPMGFSFMKTNWKIYTRLLESFGFRLLEINEKNRILERFSEKLIDEKYRRDKAYTTNILAILKPK
jgi:FkbM family methyltransferase